MADVGSDAAPDWDLVRIDFEGRELTASGICRKFGITRADLLLRARRHRWAERPGVAADREILIHRLFGLIEKHIELQENSDMKDAGEELSALGKIVSGLEKLIALDGQGRPPERRTDSKEMQDLRKKLAKRIDALRAEG